VQQQKHGSATKAAPERAEQRSELYEYYKRLERLEVYFSFLQP
jgi:hypothetical protein